MKIRKNKKKQDWLFYEEGKGAKVFKYKSEMMKYINKLGERALGGTVRLSVDHLNSSYDKREWFVWYDTNKGHYHGIFEIKLKQEDFRGRKYIHKPHSISKSTVKYFINSDKIISLMSYIGNNDYTDSNLTNLLVLFHKRGFRDFEPQGYDLDYYNRDNHKSLDVFGEWWYWSDRCDHTRMKVIHDLIKRERPEAFKQYELKI